MIIYPLFLAYFGLVSYSYYMAAYRPIEFNKQVEWLDPYVDKPNVWNISICIFLFGISISGMAYSWCQV